MYYICNKLNIFILNNFTKRLLTGIGFVSVLLSGIIFHPVLFFIIFAVITMLGLHEFYVLGKKMNADPQMGTGLLIGFTIFAITFLNAANIVGNQIFVIIIPLFVMLTVFELYRKTPYPILNIAYSLLGILWIVIPFSLFSYFVYNVNINVNSKSLINIADIYNGYNYKILLSFFLLLWSNDTFAYIFGVSFGKHRLFERISPKKSWEGFFGGLLMSVVMSVILSYYFGFYSLKFGVAIAVVISVFGTFGDLIESMFKRSVNVKDSGKILPGHGGILDRFDGVFLASPIVFFIIYLFSWL